MRFILLCLSSFLFAGVQISTAIERVHYSGAEVALGNLQLQTVSDDFANADPNHPIYIRLVLEDGIKLSETRVDLSANDFTANPIFLPLYISSDEATSLSLVASRDSVSIVRWVNGENEIWLRILRSSNTWLQNTDSSFISPSLATPVAFDLGLRDFSYAEFIESRPNNMLYATRDIENSDSSSAVSTQICADLSHSGFSINSLFKCICNDSTSKATPCLHKLPTFHL